jgi:hypothetical protein
MDKRTQTFLWIGLSTFLCACPGLISMCSGLGLASIFISDLEYEAATVIGLGALCLGVLGLMVPAGVAFFLLRKPKTYQPIYDEPIPPPN